MRERPPRVPTAFPEVLPLFPLPDHVLLPGVPTPYQVFEPRYRALVTDLLRTEERRRWLAIPRLLAPGKSTATGQPAFEPVAAAARVLQIRPLEQRRFHIVVLGEHRVRLSEVPTDEPYRKATAEALELPGAQAVASTAPAVRLAHAGLEHVTLELARVLGGEAEPLVGILAGLDDPEWLVWRLGGAVIQGADKRQAFLELPDLRARAEFVLGTLAGLLGLAHQRTDERAEELLCS